jgi:5'-nucleotidase / UDP-sugar diphosphatase
MSGEIMKACSGLFLLLLLATIHPAAHARVDTITIAHVNDTHSNLAPSGPRNESLEGSTGGIARAATMLGMLRASEPNVLALHAGDAFVGDMFFNMYFGVPELKLMKMLGFDAMTLGNHEFDLTPTVLTMALDSAFVDGGFPVLSANTFMTDPSLEGLRRHVTPYTIREIGGVRVGIFGMTTPEANVFSQPAPAIISDNVRIIAADMVDTLRSKGCQVVIMLSHLGVKNDLIIGRLTAGIDAIIGGHDHKAIAAPIAVENPIGDTTWIAQADAFYRYMGAMKLEVEDGKVRMIDYRLIPLDASVPEDPTVKSIVEALVPKIDASFRPRYSERLGHARHEMEEVATDLLEDGNKDTPIGNLIADVLRTATGADIAIVPGGSTAQGLPAGPITGNDLFRVVGYGYSTVDGLGFRVVTFDILGGSLLAGIEFGLSDIESNDERLMQVSGMSYRYNPAAPAGARLVGTDFHGVPIEPERTYRVATNEFVLMFLDGLQLPYSNASIDTTLSEYQALAGFVGTLDTIEMRSTGRIRAEKVLSVEEAPRIGNDLRSRVSPNPFIGSAELHWNQPAEAEVEIVIHSVSGVRIGSHRLGRRGAGAQSFMLDASALPAGVYHYELRAGGHVDHGMMTVMK